MELAVSGFVLDASSKRTTNRSGPVDFLPRIFAEVYAAVIDQTHRGGISPEGLNQANKKWVGAVNHRS